MTLTPGLRKLTLAVHLAGSVGWVGAAVAYLALGIAAATSESAETIRASWIAMELMGWWVLVPLAIFSIVSGIVISIGTPWGLFRYYWVIVTLVLTVFSTLVLLLHMPDVSSTADLARRTEPSAAHGLGGDILHPAIGLIVLLAITGLNVYKPRGLTHYGWRKQQEARR